MKVGLEYLEVSRRSDAGKTNLDQPLVDAGYQSSLEGKPQADGQAIIHAGSDHSHKDDDEGGEDPGPGGGEAMEGQVLAQVSEGEIKV
jgi:hypothetical protein